MQPVPEQVVQAPDVAIRMVEQIVPVDQIIPAGPLVLGGSVLVAVVLLHAIVMRWVQMHVTRRMAALRADPSTLRADMVMVSVVLAFLVAAVSEIILWTVALKYTRIFPSWAAAANFSSSCYTTLGNATVAPPRNWGMLGPIIAMSGLFTFGWSGSVLVTVVARITQVRDRHEGA